MGTLVPAILTTILKSIFRRPRPNNETVGLYASFDPHAFPSGHAARTACMNALLQPVTSSSYGRIVLSLWTIGVGVSRVILQAHFLSDVLGGWGVGLLAARALSLLAF
ncbi:MAG: phosphatase PAP2 family protein [Chloroflexi bacterium]|nr:phosphatase PAP2 family protein [Chloroflexota bacterium]